MKENRRADFSPQNGPYEVQKFINMIGFLFFCCCFLECFRRFPLCSLCAHTIVSSVIFLVILVGTERWVVCAPFISGMRRRTFWLVLLHSEYNWQWYRNDTWDWGWKTARREETRVEKRESGISFHFKYSYCNPLAKIFWKSRLFSTLFFYKSLPNSCRMPTPSRITWGCEREKDSLAANAYKCLLDTSQGLVTSVQRM